MTSKAAARIVTFRRAAAKADSSIRPHRAVLIKKAPKMKNTLERCTHEPQLKIEQPTSTFSHHLDRFFIYHAAVLFSKSTVKGHAITLVQQILQVVDSLNTERPFDTIREVGIVEGNPEAESFSS